MLSTTSKYALRALVELAKVADGDRIHGHDLAAHTGLPANYLGKILVSLSKAGLVEASRGSAGGYRLGRPASELSLLEVVELLEGPQHGSECLLRPGEPCSTAEPCSAHHEWAKLRERYFAFLAETSIGALARPPAETDSPVGHGSLEQRLYPEEDED